MEWYGRLGSQNQSRNVPYVEVDQFGRIYCLLCGTGGMFERSRRSHFNGSPHAKKYRKIKAEEEQATRIAEENVRNEIILERVRLAKQLDHGISRLGLEKWRNHIGKLMYDFIVRDDARPLEGTYVALSSILYKYEMMERISLLELAIWKANICDGLAFSAMDELHQYVVLDEKFEPSAYALERRVTSGCQIIIPRVLEFLG